MTEPTAPTEVTYTVPRWAFTAVREREQRLAKIAARIGCAPVTVTQVDIIRQPLEYRWLTDREREMESIGALVNPPVDHVVFTVTGDTPALPGNWHLLATVEHTPVGNIIAASPAGRELSLADRLAQASGTCDHCRTNRARRWTFVVRSGETGEMVRIGKGCLASHLGMHGFPEDALINWGREIADGDDWLGPSTPAYPAFGMVVAASVAAIRTFGWSPSDGHRPTREDVTRWLWAKDRRNVGFDVTADDRAKAHKVATWLTEVDSTGNDFLSNLQVLARLGLVEPRRMGTAVAAARAYDRHLEQTARESTWAAERAAAQPAPLGKAVTLTGTVTKVDVQWNDYGSRNVWTVTGDTGWRVWGTIPSGCHAEAGDRVTFTADVEPSDDVTFGFTKRPRKAQVLAKA